MSTYLSVCPRCGTKAFEKLKDHAHCVECLYVEDAYCDMETAYFQALRIERELQSAKVHKLEVSPKNETNEEAS
jgi:hypothetical protein